MSLGKREGSPEAAHDEALPAAKRVKDETTQFGGDKAAGAPPAEAYASKDVTTSHHLAKPLTPPVHSNDISESAVPQSPLDVDYIICHLNVPEGAEVARVHSNTRTADKQVQAYAKLAGRNWTFYVQQLEIVIGRAAAESNDRVDIDLGPSKIVSRRHAVIQYNLQKRQWEVSVEGRNGLRLDGHLMKAGATAALRSGHVLDVGNAQMMFVLPDAEPLVAPAFVEKAREFREQSKRLSQDLPLPLPPMESRGDPIEPPGSSYPRGVAIVSRPQVAAGQGFEQDLGSDDCKDIKPPFSYATMISQAILSTEEHMMSLADIYAWISRHYAFYRHSKPGWQNSIRHNLSLNKAFEKVARKEHEPGKGSKWHIVPEYKDDLIRKATTGKQFKNRAVSPRRSPVRDVQPVRHVPSQVPMDSTAVRGQAPMMPPLPQGQPPYGHPGYPALPLVPPGQRPQAVPLPEHLRPQESTHQGENSNAGEHQAQAPPAPGFPMPMPFQDVNGAPFPLQPFQYMQPFGMPYMPPPQQPGQPPMIPMMPPMPHHPQGQAQGRFSTSDREGEHHASSTTQQQQHYRKAEKQFEADQQGEHGSRSPSRSRSQSQSQSHSRSESQSEPRSPGQIRSSLELKRVYHTYAAQAEAEAKEPLPQQDPRALPTLSPADGSQTTRTDMASTAHSADAPSGSLFNGTETPARATRPLNGDDDTTQTPLLGAGVRLAPPNGSVIPESSPALWKYMNLESTPNNNITANGGSSRTLAGDARPKEEDTPMGEKRRGDVTSPPGSSPPVLATEGSQAPVQDMPVLKQWENNRA